jgi:DUF1009 family protein
MPSRFLPPDWDPSASIVILAGQGGGGSYPWELIQAARSQGARLKLLALKNETSPELEKLFKPEDVKRAAVWEIGGMLDCIQKMNATMNVKGLIMAGRVNTGHVFKDFFPDLKAMAIWAGLKEKNAETIFGALCAEIEKIGVRVLDARSFMDGQIAQKGVMIQGKEKVSQEAIAHAIKIAEAMAQNDVGQSVVARKGTVLAVEAFEGTDAMISRAGQYKADCKIFVKTIKNRQDWRFDAPIFGEKTLELLAANAIKTAVLKADGVIMPQKEKIIVEAALDGTTVIGY